jgi:thiol-disulfide isomerase/thioredoxin
LTDTYTRNGSFSLNEQFNVVNSAGQRLMAATVDSTGSANVNDRVVLTSEERRILGGFVRRMPVLVLAGAWCGDCVNQCPIFPHFAAASPAIDLKFLDRDARPDIAAHLKVCGGQRVPTLVFFSEDYTPVLIYGDRTLSAYRASAASQLGGTCQTGIVPPAADALAAVTGDWLREFERVQLILRLSGRLRQLHGD